MSRYNEEEWQRLKDAERERQKRKYQNKFLDDTYNQYRNERKDINTEKQLIKAGDFASIEEGEFERVGESNRYWVLSICIVLIMGCGFLFAGFYQNFFYEKTKQDLVSVGKELIKMTEIKEKKVKAQKIKAKKVKAKNVNFAKKWQRTIWEVYKGKACSKGSCTYRIEQKWRDCYRATGRCNKADSRTLERKNYKINKTRTVYL